MSLFKEQSYRGSLFIPHPEVFVDEIEGDLIVATSWGSSRTAKLVIEKIRNACSNQLNSLSLPQRLRKAALLANHFLYEEENAKEYRSGVELFLAKKEKGKLMWLQIGHPVLYLDRKNQSLTQLGKTSGLSQLEGEKQLHYLPKNILGGFAEPDIHFGDFSIKKEDRIFLINRAFIPESVQSLSYEQRSLESISQFLAKENEDMPFWIASWQVLPSNRT